MPDPASASIPHSFRPPYWLVWVATVNHLTLVANNIVRLCSYSLTAENMQHCSVSVWESAWCCCRCWLSFWELRYGNLFTATAGLGWETLERSTWNFIRVGKPGRQSVFQLRDTVEFSSCCVIEGRSVSLCYQTRTFDRYWTRYATCLGTQDAFLTHSHYLKI